MTHRHDLSALTPLPRARACDGDLRAFLRDDRGAATVDWVLLTAGLVGMAMAMMALVSADVEVLSRDVATTLESDDAISPSFAGDAPGDDPAGGEEAPEEPDAPDLPDAPAEG